MSNSIWKMTNIKPEEDKDIVFMYGSLPTMGCYKNNDDAYVEYATGEIFYSNEVERWAYLADIIAQADKAERLQKQLDGAIWWCRKPQIHTDTTDEMALKELDNDK